MVKTNGKMTSSIDKVRRLTVPLVALAAVLTGLVSGGCEGPDYPEPTQQYSAVGGFELTAVTEDPGPYSVGYAERDYWYPYSMGLDAAGDLLVNNCRGAFIERFRLEEDGGAQWTAYWAWGRGHDEDTYPLFVCGYGDDPDLVLVSEAYTVGMHGARAYLLELPEPDQPGEMGRPPWAYIYTSRPTDTRDVGFAWVSPVRRTFFNFYQPGDIAAEPFPGGSVIVSDTGTGAIRLYDADGVILATGGGTGDQEGVFRLPLGLAYGPGQTLAVADTWNHRIQLFEIIDTPQDPEDPDYKRDYTLPKLFAYRRTIGSFGYHNGEMSAPYGVCFDDDGNIYVADTRNGRVQKFDGEGRLLAVIYGEGDWRLRAPLDVVVDLNGDLLVLDAFVWYAPWDEAPLPDEGGRVIRFRRR